MGGGGASQQQVQQIGQYLLSLRDVDNNLILNLNQATHWGETALSIAIDKGDTNLLQLLLDTRTATGEMALRLTNITRKGSPLRTALRFNKLAHLQLLVDARKANGEPVYTLEQLQAALIAETVFFNDNGTLRFDDIRRNEASRWLDDYLGARDLNPSARAVAGPIVLEGDVADEALAPVPLPVVAVIPAVIPPPPFYRVGQNTHNTEVTVSIDASMNRLKIRYPDPIAAAPTLDEIRAFITSLPGSAQKNSALRCFDDIASTTTIRMGCELTQAQALSLVWRALNDNSAAVEGVATPLSAADITERRKGLVTCLAEAQNTYGPGRPSCFVGTFNKIAEAANGVHPDVTIIMGNSALLPIVRQRAKIVAVDEFKKKTIRTQRAILRDWANTDPASESTLFRDEAKTEIERVLTNGYAVLLAETRRTEIASETVRDLLLTDVHRPLGELIEYINGLPEADETHATELTALKAQATNAFAESDRSLEEEYSLLVTNAESVLRAHLRVKLQASHHPEFAALFERLATELGGLGREAFMAQYGDNLERIKGLTKLLNLYKRINEFAVYGSSPGCIALQANCRAAINEMNTAKWDGLDVRLITLQKKHLADKLAIPEEGLSEHAKRYLKILKATLEANWLKMQFKKQYETVRKIIEQFSVSYPYLHLLVENPGDLLKKEGGQSLESATLDQLEQFSQQIKPVSDSLAKNPEIVSEIMPEIILPILAIRQQYKGRNQGRLAAITQLEQKFLRALREYVASERPDLYSFRQEVDNILQVALNDVTRDHQNSAALSFMIGLQPRSRLAVIISETMDLIESRRPKPYFSNVR